MELEDERETRLQQKVTEVTPTPDENGRFHTRDQNFREPVSFDSEKYIESSDVTTVAHEYLSYGQP